ERANGAPIAHPHGRRRTGEPTRRQLGGDLGRGGYSATHGVGRPGPAVDRRRIELLPPGHLPRGGGVAARPRVRAARIGAAAGGLPGRRGGRPPVTAGPPGPPGGGTGGGGDGGGAPGGPFPGPPSPPSCLARFPPPIRTRTRSSTRC